MKFALCFVLSQEAVMRDLEMSAQSTSHGVSNLELR